MWNEFFLLLLLLLRLYIYSLHNCWSEGEKKMPEDMMWWKKALKQQQQQQYSFRCNIECDIMLCGGCYCFRVISLSLPLSLISQFIFIAIIDWISFTQIAVFPVLTRWLTSFLYFYSSSSLPLSLIFTHLVNFSVWMIQKWIDYRFLLFFLHCHRICLVLEENNRAQTHSEISIEISLKSSYKIKKKQNSIEYAT